MTTSSKKHTVQLAMMSLLFTLLTKVLLTEATWSNSSRCVEMEREALLQFRQGLKDPSGQLSSWVGEDCCSWVGVGCGNQTGHVLSLDLEGYRMSSTLSPLLNLTHLNYLDLSSNNFQGSPIPNFLGSFKELRYLDLRGANFSGMIPSGLGNLSNLEYLDLSYNYFSSKVPQWLSNMSALHIVNIHNSSLTGSINEVSFEKLCDLKALDLSHNAISGDIKEFLKALSECSNHSLSSLNLLANKITGNLPDSLGLFRNMEIILLHQNSILGPVPTSIGNLSHLSELDLADNMIKGPIPQSIGQLKELIGLALYENSWEGTITENHFQNLTKLRGIFLSSTSNSLVFNVRHDWIPPFRLGSLIISDCTMGPHFPAWIRTQNEIEYLTLSNVSISGSIPDWLWTALPNLDSLYLPKNQLVGKLPSSENFRLKLGAWVDLGFNYLDGPIPLWQNVSVLSLRDNLFFGPIPPNIGHEMSGLESLGLSKNNLSGTIPLSFKNMKSLTFLDLSSNNLSGKILQQLKGLQNLRIIDLSKNNLSGNLSSLQDCSNLSFVELGGNSLSGNLPKWIAKSLYSVSYLGLRSNMLTGNIPDEVCQLPELHILDLAYNDLSGPIPECLGSLVALKSHYGDTLWTAYGPYYQQLELVVKGSEYEYSKMVSLVNTIDLSSNNLTGQIPEEINNLTSLGFLNLSRNQLTGKIPENVGSLQSLESLDLSHNHLSGQIPPSMSSMTFLNYLVLSYNNLSGQIPSSTQFQTFNQSSFEGNPGLCGPPLSTNCSSPNDEGAQGKNEGDGEDNEGDGEDNEGGIDKFAFLLSMGLGFSFGFWAVCGSLAIKKSWRIAFFKFLDEKIDWLYVVIVVNLARLRRKLERQQQ